MLKSNWSIGDAKSWGRVHVIRQKLGRAAPRKSKAGHVFLTVSQRSLLCAKLERQAR
jgi:hypothetical protein